jgi:hypothetical protein
MANSVGLKGGGVLEFDKELFKREYLCEWIENTSYTEAYKLWLWYNYHCELYNSKICTGSNEYGDYMPASIEEHRAVNKNAYQNLQHIQTKRELLKQEGVNISNEDWRNAKKHFSKYKLKALEQEYEIYFKEE